MVDVQSAARTEVLQRDVIDALPTPRNTQSIGYLAQGVRLTRPDVGGSQMMEQVQMISHGANSAHSTMQVDGMIVNAALGDGRIMNYNNQALAQEMAVSTSGSPAEVQAGGIRLNMIPKDGGNTISGSFYGGFTDGAWQADNLDTDLRSQGLTSVDGITNIHDVNPSFGGPFIRDRLWYFTSVRAISVDELKLGSIFQDTPHTPAELVGQQGVMEQHVRSGLLRLTSQLSQQNKVSAYLDRIFKFKGREFGSNVEPTLAASHRDPGHANYHTFQTKWTSTISSRVLLEVGFSQVQEIAPGREPAEQAGHEPFGRRLRHVAAAPERPEDLHPDALLPPAQLRPDRGVVPGWRASLRMTILGTRENGYGLNIWVTPDHRWTTSYGAVVRHGLPQLQGRHAMGHRGRWPRLRVQRAPRPALSGWRARHGPGLQLAAGECDESASGSRPLRPGHLDDRPVDDQRRRPDRLVRLAEQPQPRRRCDRWRPVHRRPQFPGTGRQTVLQRHLAAPYPGLRPVRRRTHRVEGRGQPVRHADRGRVRGTLSPGPQTSATRATGSTAR